jgi:glycerol-3-phosphate acyltransferase PlsY
MFPLTRRFRGGKGVATMGGAMLALHPATSLVLLAVWLVIRKLTGKASLASLFITVGLPVGIAVSGAPGWEIVYVVALCALVLVRHVDNIKRLIGRRELSATSR